MACRAMRIKGVLIAASLVISSPVTAADSDGNYASYGVGTWPCSAISVVQKPAYTQRFLNWLDGFLTAFNLLKPGTYSITPTKDSAAKFPNAVLDYCHRNPHQTVANAANYIAIMWDKYRALTGRER
jgi:hypothetical protein